MAQLEELLQQCTVQITIPDQPGWGTGFFVAPGLILTCAHVVKTLAVGAAARIRWQQQADFATAELVQLVPNFDLALLQFTPPNAALPCVYLDEELQPGQELYFFGYPDQDFDNGCPVTGSCEGFTGDVPPLIKFKQAQVRPGMSGSALLNRHTGKVCGMVKFTRDRSFDLGGGAIPTRVILEQFPQLRELQREFHQSDRLWHDLVTTQSEIDFQPYLRSILNNEDYREWQEVYTPTKVEDRQRLPSVTLAESPQSRFSRHLKLRVETVKPPESGHQRTEATDRQEQVEQLDVLAGLRKYAPEHVLLVGKPGSGKSTSLERLLWEEADQALKQPTEAKIPVLVKLRRCTGTIEALMQDFCRSHQLPLTLADIETLLDQGKLLLLLDGLNELPEAFRTNAANFRDRYRATTPMIVSTRELSLGGNLGIAKTLKMLPLTEPQMQEFVRGYLGQEGNHLWQQLKGDRLGKFAETPLLLWMLCRVFAQNGRVPANLGLAFREFTQLYDVDIQQDAPAASREQWFKLLRHLAFALMHDQEPTAFRLSMSREEAVDRLTTCLQQEGRANARDGAERGLKDLLSYHLIQPVMQPHYEEHIEFRHQLIQEYYAAEYLLRLLPTLSDEQLQREYLNYLKWTEPVALMLVLVEQEAHALGVVKLALDVDLMLGARLAGEVQSKFQEIAVTSVIEEIRKQTISPTYEIQLLGNTHSSYAVSILLAKLADEETQNLILESAFALREIGSRSAVQKLLALLGYDNQIIVIAALFALGKLGDEEILPDLQRTLIHRVESIRRQTVEALGELGSHTVLPDLRQALEDPSNRVREKAVEALGSLGDESALPELIKIAVEEHDISAEAISLRWTSAKALGQINSEKAIEALLRVLKHEENHTIRENAAEALGKVGSEAAIDGLIASMESHPADSSAAKALVEIGSRKAIPGLIQALKHSVPCEQAAYVLGELGDATAVPDLIGVLYHWWPQIREQAVEALGKIGDRKAIPNLYELYETLQDNSRTRNDLKREVILALGKLGDERVRQALLNLLNHQALGSTLYRYDWWKVFEALEKIGGQPVTLALTQVLLKSPNPKNRWKAAEALGNLLSETAIDGLLTALADDNSTVRWKSAEALAKFNSQQVMPKLSPLLKDDVSNVRSAAVQVLSGFEDESAVTALLEALDDSDLGVRYDAVQSLVKLSNSCVRLSASKVLGHPWKRKLLNDGFIYPVQAIKENSKFYNYEIAHSLTPPGKAIALYFSSSPSDADLQTQLANHLNLLERQGIITSWHHRQMLPGDERAQVINDRLNSADIILLLISADSIADHTCYDIEINRAMERHQASEARVIPILLCPVDWQGAPFSQLPVWPKNQQPVTSWSDRDAAFQEIAEGIREVAIELRRTKGTGA